MSDSSAEVVSNETNFSTGARRSSDKNHLDFTSMPIVGIIGVAKTAQEGAEKYGRYNFMKGMPVHDILNHVFGHLYSYILGDRSEPHLEHASWGCLCAVQSSILDPELSKDHLLGPGATLTADNIAFLDANADKLAELRKSGFFNGIGGWDLRDIPEIARLLGQRTAISDTKAHIAASVTDHLDAVEAMSDFQDGQDKPRKKRRTKLEMVEAKAALAALSGPGPSDNAEPKHVEAEPEAASDEPESEEFVL